MRLSFVRRDFGFRDNLIGRTGFPTSLVVDCVKIVGAIHRQSYVVTIDCRYFSPPAKENFATLRIDNGKVRSAQSAITHGHQQNGFACACLNFLDSVYANSLRENLPDRACADVVDPQRLAFVLETSGAVVTREDNVTSVVDQPRVKRFVIDVSFAPRDRDVKLAAVGVRRLVYPKT